MEDKIEYTTDKDGKWKLRKGKKYQLIEPSQEYIISNTSSQKQLDNEANIQLIKEMAEESLGLIRIVEDISEYLEAKNDGFVIPVQQKERISKIKEKRKLLK